MKDTIAALSTPNGESAIAVIRLSGDMCKNIARDCMNCHTPSPRLAKRADYTNMSGEILDDVMFVFFKGPSSYTGEDVLEISCHGNPFIVQNILEDLIRRGVRAASAGEFTRRAFLNDKMDLSQAEGVALMISAGSKRALRAAQKQFGGDLGKRINSACSTLVDTLAQIEAYIDFPDEDLPPENAKKIFKECEDLLSKTRKLIESSRYAPLVYQGLNVVIAGAPNAGKSSLLNALLGRERAIVSGESGTTRDFISERAIIGDYAVNIVDTAGLRETQNEIESKGIELAMEKISEADICLLAFDTSEKILKSQYSETSGVLKNFIAPENTIVVENKIDLENSDTSEIDEKFANFERVKVSCTNGFGIESLKSSIVAMIEKYKIFPSPDDIIVGARHALSLESACENIECAMEKIRSNQPSELTASDLRCALENFGEIVGKTDNEAVLDAVFSKFCIGK